MNYPGNSDRQRGVALVISLLFLLVVTIISITAASNSGLNLRMTSNMQDSFASFQAAEAGIYGTIGLVGGPNDPFRRVDDLDPFAGVPVPNNPLRGMPAAMAAAIAVEVEFVAADRSCPRPRGNTGGDSYSAYACDYYQVDSEHDVPGRARTKVELGVVKTIL